MLTRVDFFRLKEECSEQKIDISDIEDIAKKLISSLGHLRNYEDILLKVDALRNTELEIKNIFNLSVSKMSFSNSIIEAHNKIYDTQTLFSVHTGMAMQNLRDLKENVVRTLQKTEGIDNDAVTGKMILDSYMIYVQDLMENLIYNSIKQGLRAYNKSNGPLNLDFMEGDFEKGEEYFWFLVFRYFLSSIMVVASIPLELWKKVIGEERLANLLDLIEKRKEQSGEGEREKEQEEEEFTHLE